MKKVLALLTLTLFLSAGISQAAPVKEKVKTEKSEKKKKNKKAKKEECAEGKAACCKKASQKLLSFFYNIMRKKAEELSAFFCAFQIKFLISTGEGVRKLIFILHTYTKLNI